jgi:hypothetical protein
VSRPYNRGVRSEARRIREGADPSPRSTGPRVVRAWGALDRDRRLVAVAAVALFLTMLLPWYSETDTFVVHGQTRPAEVSLTAFQAFSFVEAAVLVVAGGVLLLLFARAEGRPFQLPGGDGLVILVAGAWAGLLIFYRLLDKPGTRGTATLTTTVGVKWGIFLALLAAILMAYAGAMLRAGRRPEPPLVRDPRRPRAPEQPSHEPRSPAREPKSPRARKSASHISEPLRSDQLDEDETAVIPHVERTASPTSIAARERPRYPPAPPSSARAPGRAGSAIRTSPEQLSFEDPEPGSSAR